MKNIINFFLFHIVISNKSFLVIKSVLYPSFSRLVYHEFTILAYRVSDVSFRDLTYVSGIVLIFRNLAFLSFVDHTSKKHFPLSIPRSIVSRYKLFSSCSLSFKNHPSRVETQTSPVFVPAPLYFFRPTSYGRHLYACRLYVARLPNTSDNPQRSTGVNHPANILPSFLI